MIAENTLKKAMHYQQQNQLDQAMQLYNEILSHTPNNPDALHGQGLAYAQINNIPKAIEYLKQAVQAAPGVPAFHNNLGNAYKAARQFELALKHYFEALKLKGPAPYPQVHNNLGGLYYLQGNMHKAIEQFQKSIRMQPQRADTHFNLANCYIQNNRLLDAIPHFEAVLKEQPEHLAALHNLGIAFTALKNFAQAKPLLEKVVERESNNLEALFHLALIEASEGYLDTAEDLYSRVLALDPEHADSYHNLATIYLHQQEKAKALEYYSKALKLNPYNSTAQHMINALTGTATPEGAPADYIRALFDQYAYNYDAHVKTQLEYGVPLLLREAISPFCSLNTPKSASSESPSLWNVLDLGCGTGLCAPYFRDIAGKLTGVDLSPNMIEIASAQGGYDKLVVSDIHDYLIQPNIPFNLIIAADVFVYFSDLESIFRKIQEALKPQGLFIFSLEIEIDAQSEADYRLEACGRYKHHPKIIEKISKKLDFKILDQKEAILRKEANQAVSGMICVLRKP